MSDTPVVDTNAPAPQVAEPGTETEPVVDLAAEVEKWRALSKKNEERAKTNAKAAQDLEQFRQQSMTDTEKAIEAARSEARSAVLIEVGGKLAAAEVRAAAAGRLDAAQVDMLLESLNLARFVDSDGEVDRDAVAKFVDGIAPKASGPHRFGDVDLGVRQTTPAPDSDGRATARSLFQSGT